MPLIRRLASAMQRATLGKFFFFFVLTVAEWSAGPPFVPPQIARNKQTCDSDTKNFREFGGKEGIKKLIWFRLSDIPSRPRRQRPPSCSRGLAIARFPSWYFLLLNSRGKRKKSISLECMFVLDSGGGLASPCLRKVAGLAGECVG